VVFPNSAECSMLELETSKLLRTADHHEICTLS
jgi:hypothetical protein